MEIGKSTEQEPLLKVHEVIDKSTGIKYRIQSTDSDFLCELAKVPEEEFPTGMYVEIMTYEIDSMADYPDLRKMLFGEGEKNDR